MQLPSQPHDAITRQENKHSLQVFSPLVAIYYYVGWQEGDLQSTMAQKYVGVETCVFLHTHQQSNRSANIQQKELKPEGKWKLQFNPARIYLINTAMWTHFIPVDVPVIFVQSMHMEHYSPTNSPLKWISTLSSRFCSATTINLMKNLQWYLLEEWLTQKSLSFLRFLAAPLVPELRQVPSGAAASCVPISTPSPQPSPHFKALLGEEQRAKPQLISHPHQPQLLLLMRGLISSTRAL